MVLSKTIALLKKGDKFEFEKIYLSFYDLLYSISLQYTADKAVAESMVQDVFLKLWEIREDLLPETNIKNLLYTLTKNLCLNYLRHQKVTLKYINQVKACEYEYAIESLNSIGENVTEFEELKTKIKYAISHLPDDLRIVFQMSRDQNLKYREISERLSISQKTVEARMNRALKILRTELKDFLPAFYIFLLHHPH